MQRNLLTRVLTGVLWLPVLLFLIHLGGWGYRGFVLLCVVLGAWEWWRLGRPLAGGGEFALLIVGTAGALLCASELNAEHLGLFLALFASVSCLISLRHSDGRALERIGHLVVGILYVGLLPAFLIRIRALPIGREALFLAYGAVFICDTCAYGLGRTLGRHSLWPRISPRKTWEGAAGGLLGALAAAIAGQAWFAGFLDLASALGFGLIVGTLGQMGDLVESLWKREAGVKDSSRLIPGHGGVLDRFDNIHFIAPILYTYLILVS